jgi:hypothetical protein
MVIVGIRKNFIFKDRPVSSAIFADAHTISLSCQLAGLSLRMKFEGGDTMQE